jgi:beta-aspartyl-peptidase (threonine type)
MDAVEAAVRQLEDMPFFNAGVGSVLNRDGFVEMDAMIVDGKTLNAGAVTMVRTVKNPITLARRVLEHSPHIFLGGEGAERFARAQGLEIVDPASLVTPARREQLRTTLASDEPGTKVCVVQDAAAALHPDDKDSVAEAVRHALCTNADEGDHDTVGAVAVDFYGNVAAATSTGGLTAKWAGRIGDTPIYGAGGYADNAAGAASTTGTGELIIRALLAKSVCDEYERLGDYPDRAAEAVTRALRKMKLRVGGPGAGVIFVSPTGEIGIGHSSARMSWAAIRGGETDAVMNCSAEITQQPEPGIHVIPNASLLP